jgi:hypothetical protein
MKQNLPGGSSAVVPPDPMPNSEVKRRSADGSVGSPHARVGNCQASNKWKAPYESTGLFAMGNLALHGLCLLVLRPTPTYKTLRIRISDRLN